MVVCNGLQEIVLQNVALARVEALDPARTNLSCSPEEALPPRHWVGADNGMRCLEVEANILRCSTLAIDEFDVVTLCCIEKFRRVVSRGQSFGKLLKCRTETVVRFVAGCPEGVSASIIGELGDLENGVVGRNRLEGDTAGSQP